MFRPKLTKVPPRGRFGKAVSDLNRAVSDRSGVRAGDGMGGSSGPMGQFLYDNAPILMYAKSGDDGVPPAEDDDDGNRTPGKGDVAPVRISIDGDGDRVLKPNKEDPITAYNMGLTEVGANHYLVLAKVLGVWQVIWEECESS